MNEIHLTFGCPKCECGSMVYEKIQVITTGSGGGKPCKSKLYKCTTCAHYGYKEVRQLKTEYSTTNFNCLACPHCGLIEKGGLHIDRIEIIDDETEDHINYITCKSCLFKWREVYEN